MEGNERVLLRLVPIADHRREEADSERVLGEKGRERREPAVDIDGRSMLVPIGRDGWEGDRGGRGGHRGGDQVRSGSRKVGGGGRTGIDGGSRGDGGLTRSRRVEEG